MKKVRLFGLKWEYHQIQSRLCNWVVGSLFSTPEVSLTNGSCIMSVYKCVINTQLGAHHMVQSMTTLACGSRSQAGWPTLRHSTNSTDRKTCRLSDPSLWTAPKKHSRAPQSKLWQEKYTLICLQAVFWLQHEMCSASTEKSVIQQSYKIQVKPGKQLLMLYWKAGSKPSHSNCRKKPQSTAAKCCEHLYISSLTASVKTQQAFTLKYSNRNSCTNFPAGLPAQLYPPHDAQWLLLQCWCYRNSKVIFAPRK